MNFALPLLELENSISPVVKDAIMKYFHHDQSKMTTQGSFTIKMSPDGSQPQIDSAGNKFMEWIFTDSNNNKITLTSQFLICDIHSYEHFGKLSNELDQICIELFKSNSDLEISQLGLRYINVIEIPGRKPTSWDEYLSSNLLGIFKMSLGEAKIARAFQNLVINYDDGMRLNFQYGMHNPDFPASIRKKQFVLDYDAVYKGSLNDSRSLKEVLGQSHENIKALFELNIKKKLRDIMEVVEVDQ